LSIMLLQLNNDVTTLLTTCSYRGAAHASVFTPVNINREQVVRWFPAVCVSIPFYILYVFLCSSRLLVHKL
jgi:hypothetical protein